MADIQNTGNASSREKKRALKGSIRMDMTPMVDLAFLLLTFFILTTSMQNPKSLQMTFPLDSGPPTKINNAITLLLAKDNRVLYYVGELKRETQLQETNYAELGDLIRSLNKTTYNQINAVNEKYKHMTSTPVLEEKKKNTIDSIQHLSTTLFCIIKPTDHATYGNMVDVVDEMDINGVNKYAVSDKFQPQELQLLEQILTK